MAGRKPPKATFESWVDRQIRDGLARGAFDDLPGGPLDLSDAHDEDWWLKRKIRDEQLDVLPPSLVLRREVEQAVRDARDAPTEDEARRRIEAVNERIRAANRIAIAGPPVTLVTYDVEAFLHDWRRRAPALASSVQDTAVPPPVPPTAVPRRRRWRRRSVEEAAPARDGQPDRGGTGAP